MPDDKELKQSLDLLNKSLEGINQSLSVLSAMKIAEEFYTKEERRAFYKQYEQYQEQAEKARADLFEQPGSVTKEMMDIAAKANKRVTECIEKHPALVTLYRNSR